MHDTTVKHHLNSKLVYIPGTITLR